MQRASRNACLLMLATSGLLPAESFADPAALASRSHRQRLDEALSTARRTLELERYLLQRLETIRDPGMSPSYAEELEASRQRVLEAEAWVRALERALGELAPFLEGSAPGPPLAPERPRRGDAEAMIETLNVSLSGPDPVPGAGGAPPDS